MSQVIQRDPPETEYFQAVRDYCQLVVMEQFSRQIIASCVQASNVDHSALRRMFNQAICGQALAVRLSFDHDPLFELHCWQANLRIADASLPFNRSTVGA